MKKYKNERFLEECKVIQTDYIKEGEYDVFKLLNKHIIQNYYARK